MGSMMGMETGRAASLRVSFGVLHLKSDISGFTSIALIVCLAVSLHLIITHMNELDR